MQMFTPSEVQAQGLVYNALTDGLSFVVILLYTKECILYT